MRIASFRFSARRMTASSSTLANGSTQDSTVCCIRKSSPDETKTFGLSEVTSCTRSSIEGRHGFHTFICLCHASRSGMYLRAGLSSNRADEAALLSEIPVLTGDCKESKLQTPTGVSSSSVALATARPTRVVLSSVPFELVRRPVDIGLTRIICPGHFASD